MKTETERHLKVIGFKRVESDDKSTYWMQKNIKHQFIKNLHIIVEEFKNVEHITVYCSEPEFNGNFEGDLVIIREEFSVKKLREISKMFEV